jgi:1-aminocyclopropane-1-carboxylate deaminase/D-cysteine desulfhydrase-like pyridoxal-dependent ACC family enzyme
MGQQQLLLIVLGVIIVGIAVVVGINLFNANAESSTQDSIVSQGTNLGAMAQQYFKKPVAMGGGGNAYSTKNGGIGFSAYFNNLPAALKQSTDATWVVTSTADTTVVITATPADANYKWTVITTISPVLGIRSAVTQN